MPFPPIQKSLEGLLEDTAIRLTLVERRLAKAGLTPYELPDRLSETGEQVTDWNLALLPGFYWSDVGALNAPTSDNFVGTVIHHGTLDRDVQELWLPAGGVTVQRTWRRTRTGISTWGVWVEVDRMATAADVGDIIAGTDLNTVLETGWYVQPASANATLALNYPVTRAGHLEVSFSSGGNDFCLQTYTEYAPFPAGSVSRQWRRTYYGPTWQPWFLINSDPPRPEPIRYAVAGGTIAATAWGTLVPTFSQQSMTTLKPLWVLVTVGAWMIASAGDTRMGVALSGATVFDPPSGTQQAGSASSWGQIGYTHLTDSGAGSGQRTIQRLFLLNAGTTNFRLEAYMGTAGTHNVNYPVLEVIPLYYDGS